MQWKEFNSESCWDDNFIDELVECIEGNQMLILVRDSKYEDDNEIYFDMAIYDSTFPHLTDKRYSKDRKYFYLPFTFLVHVIGRRFEGYSNDITDFMVNIGVSVPHVMQMDTIQRACGLLNIFGLLAVQANTVLPSSWCVTAEHSGMVVITTDQLTGIAVDSRMYTVCSKVGAESCGAFQQTVHDISTNTNFTPCLLVTTEGQFDLLGGRLKFHEAMDCDLFDNRVRSSGAADVRGVVISDDRQVTSGGVIADQPDSSSTDSGNISSHTSATAVDSGTCIFSPGATTALSNHYSLLTKGVVEGFLREMLEELNICAAKEVLCRRYVDGVHYLYCCKDGLNLLLRVRPAELVFMFVVEVSNFNDGAVPV